jgi:hypothetical protein
MFEISSNPAVPLSQIRERRIDLIERAQDMAVHDITSSEDSAALQILDAVALGCNRIISVTAREFSTPQFIEATLQRAFESISLGHSFRGIFPLDIRNLVSNVFMNPLDFATIMRCSGGQPLGRRFLIQEIAASVIRTGILARL